MVKEKLLEVLVRDRRVFVMPVVELAVSCLVEEVLA